jgi:hypothetical protein
MWSSLGKTTDFVKGGARENRPPRGHIIVSGKKIVTENEKLREKDCYGKKDLQKGKVMGSGLVE